MGWLVSMDRTKDRKRLVEEILEDFRRNEYPYPALLDHSQKGNTLYMVLHNPVRRVNGVKPAGHLAEDLRCLEYQLVGNYRFVAVYLLAGPRRKQDDEGWGYKSMDESMGPNVYDCPERLLKQSQVNDRWGWRAECRQKREEAKRRKAWAKNLKPGTELQMHRGWKLNEETRRQEPTYETVVYVRPHSPTFFVGRFAGESPMYRMRWSDLKVPEQREEAA